MKLEEKREHLFPMTTAKVPGSPPIGLVGLYLYLRGMEYFGLNLIVWHPCSREEDSNPLKSHVLRRISEE